MMIKINDKKKEKERKKEEKKTCVYYKRIGEHEMYVTDIQIIDEHFINHVLSGVFILGEWCE